MITCLKFYVLILKNNNVDCVELMFPTISSASVLIVLLSDNSVSAETPTQCGKAYSLP